ncbi:MAG: NAD-dependent epimerase/dehydratase family protein [Opitutae bacterium]|nr:NAD-dependent epimerase/dehydratase family protein [Opitutae bacterium]
MSVSPAQRIIVTGGRGRLASLVAEHFRPPARAVELYSRQAGPGFHDLAGLGNPARLAGAAAVLHFAWSTLPATSEAGGGLEAQVDLPQLERLLAALATVPAQQRPLFVFFSSGGTAYGNAPGRPSVEDDPLHPIGWYGRAKAAAEQLIAEHGVRAGVECAVLRVSNPYGYPVPSDRAQGIIPHAVRCALTRQQLTLWGDGSARKDFLYYTDFLAAVELVVDRRLTGTFNVAAGASHSISEILALVEKQTGCEILLDRRPARTWDVHDSLLDHRRFSATTGWQPQVPLTEGISRAVREFQTR